MWPSKVTLKPSLGGPHRSSPLKDEATDTAYAFPAIGDSSLRIHNLASLWLGFDLLRPLTFALTPLVAPYPSQSGLISGLQMFVRQPYFFPAEGDISAVSVSWAEHLVLDKSLLVDLK